MSNNRKAFSLPTIFALAICWLASSPAWSDASPSAYIISPKNGATVSSPVTVLFGLVGMGVAPAGVERANTGHHHLLVDVETLPALDQPLGADAIHFGAGQTQTTIELEPGTHTLQLILGDHLHRPHNPPVISEKITITVKPSPLADLAIKNLHNVSAHMYASGQPSPEQFEALAKNGIKNVINLRTTGEMTWDEAALAKKLGINYHQLPVNGIKGITMENAKALAMLIDSLGNEKTLVHCASGNRVGALIALQRSSEGGSIDDAIAEGKRWGLTRLESVVRKKLDN